MDGWPGDGVTVGGFPRCEADFIAERNTWCVISRAILHLSFSCLLLCLIRFPNQWRSLDEKKVRSCDRYKTDESCVATESGVTFLSTKRSRPTPRVLVLVARERTVTSCGCIRLVFAIGADNYLRSSRVCGLHAILRTHGCSVRCRSLFVITIPAIPEMFCPALALSRFMLRNSKKNVSKKKKSQYLNHNIFRLFA